MKDFFAKNKISFHQESQCPQRALVPQLMRPQYKSINSNQNVPSSNNNQQDLQTKTFQKRAEFWRSSEECVEEMGGDNVAEDGSNQSGTWKLRREAKWISKRVRHVFPTPIK